MSTMATATTSKVAQFWSDELAARLVRERDRFVISTGITPSGEIHIGHLREVVTAHAVWLSLKELGQEADFHYFADSLDPLRKIYPFLDAKTYAEHVGKPIGKIPCPCGKHSSYASHFVEPFLASLKELGMSPRVIYADEAYRTDGFVEVITIALQQRQRIAEILQKQTGKEIKADWSPFNPICNHCQRISTAVVTGFDSDRKVVSYRCECGDEGEVSMRGGGKLTWRVDWPARWRVLGVTMEPFGKDHSTRGGSYDTGTLISEQVFQYPPPLPMPYEWISLKGMGDMSSSKGNVISIHTILQAVPPEVLRYFILRSHPSKRLTFDPTLPLLNLIDEFDRSIKDATDRPSHLANISNAPSIGIPFRHLVTILQIVGMDERKVGARLQQAGYQVTDPEVLKRYLSCVKNWLERYAPEEVKFSLQEKLPEVADELTVAQRQALKRLAERLQTGMTGDAIHKLVYSIREECELSPQEIFAAIYMVLLGKRRGPRVGMFLSALDRTWVQRRFREV